MTRETLIKHWDVIQAFKEGKKIEYFSNFDGKWVNVKNPSFDIECSYRVKPESTKRLPTIEEVERWFLENKVFRYKRTGTLERIMTFQSTNETPICDADREWHCISGFCEKYTHYDGSELYIIE